jgi:hypothetical protein
LHLAKPREAIAAVRTVLREADAVMSSIESDAGLNAEGIRKRRAEAARTVVKQLESLPEVASAESAVNRRIEVLKKKVNEELAFTAPRDAVEAQVAAEIRAHVKASKAPALTALSLKADKRAMQAITSAPAYLSGLTDAELSSVRNVVLSETENAPLITAAEDTLRVVHGAIRAARNMISERVLPGDLDDHMMAPAKARA